MTFFEVVTGGRHPFEDLFEQHPREALRAQRERVPCPPSTFLSGSYSPMELQAMDQLFAKACAKAKEDRYADANAMKSAFEELLQLS